MIISGKSAAALAATLILSLSPPFLAAQDICGPYVTGAVRRGANVFLVDVFGECGGRRDSVPNPVAEVAARGGTWVFTNFLYPGEPATRQ